MSLAQRRLFGKTKIKSGDKLEVVVDLNMHGRDGNLQMGMNMNEILPPEA